MKADIKALKAKLYFAEMSMGKMAEALDVDRSTLYARLQNGAENLRLKDLHTIAKVLDLSDEEIIDIFFSKKPVKIGFVK